MVKSDTHYHEDGAEGVPSATPTSYSTQQDWNIGINEGHLLLFGDGLIHAGLWNKGAGENCRYGKKYAGMEGIVKNVLPESGYPEINLDMANAILTGDGTVRDYTLIKDYLLTGDHKDDLQNNDGYTYDSSNVKNLSDTVLNSWRAANSTGTESLQYLFEPADGSYKKAYPNVTGLFQLDDDGYYYYNMRKNFAELSQDGGNHFILYDAPATTRTDGTNSIGNFFPFNKGSEVFNGVDSDGHLTSSVDCARNAMNHHLGMTVEVGFRQPVEGKINTGSKGQQPMTFGFSGDDDVWVFIDDVLVLDLGGIHSELYGIIDFASGNVLIGRGFENDVQGIPPYDPAHPENTPHQVTSTNLLELYQSAKKAEEMQWNGNTYASNTSHTLKMFYLERGNYDSSIALRFNLQPLLHQQIQKVDQDGDPLPGVEFALYPAERLEAGEAGAIECLYTDSGTSGTDGQTFYVRQAAGSGPLVSLTTGSDGVAVFLEKDGTYFNFADRGEQYYLLRETTAPGGYRRQPVDIVLHYNPATAMLSVANRWTTGAYACSVVNVAGTEIGNSDEEDGLVVAVPLVKEGSQWLALYGGNLIGFQSKEAGTDISNLSAEAVLAAAIEQAKTANAADWYMDWDSGNKRLKGTLTDLPGLGTRYLLNNPTGGDMHMAYGLIPASALRCSNTSTIAERYAALQNADSAALASQFKLLDVSRFNRDFRSLIYIPNERRELRVLKVDQDGNPRADAEFTLFSDAGCTQRAAYGTTGADGMLIFSPTGDGTRGQAQMVWAKGGNTQYYLKETRAPAGCESNDNVIPVVVGQYSIYADAGRADDGVKVMAGVGKLTQTVRQYAVKNDVDITLRDITAFMQTQPSGSFQADGWTDTHLAGTNIPRSMNLHFGRHALVDYGLHDEDGGENLSPFFVTDTGFVRTRVQQNYAALAGGQYGGEESNANRDNLGSTDLTNLFSLLNTVVVTDQTKSDTETGQLTIGKTVTGSGLDAADYNENFTFTVELTDAAGQPLTGTYAYRFYGADKAGFLDREHNTLLLHHDDSVTILGLPAGTQYKVTEAPASGWHAKPSGGVITGAIADGQTSEAKFENSRAPFPEEPKPETGSLSVSKTITGENLTDEDRAKDFTFTLTLRDAAGKTLSGQYPCTVRETGAADGAQSHISSGGTFTLRHNQTLIIEGLPEGAQFTITETPADGWNAKDGVSAGTIGAGETSAAAFTNIKEAGTPPTDPEDPGKPPENPDDPTDPPKDPDDPTEPPKDPDHPTEPPKDPDDPTEPPKDPDDPTENPPPKIPRRSFPRRKIRLR